MTRARRAAHPRARYFSALTDERRRVGEQLRRRGQELRAADTAARRLLADLVFLDLAEARQVTHTGEARARAAIAAGLPPAERDLLTERLARARADLDAIEIPVAWLGELHEHWLGLHAILDEEARFALAAGGDRGRGARYTPGAVTRFLVEAALASRPSALPTILDPACGAGAFLIAAFDLLVERERALRDPSDPSWPAHLARLLTDHLRGIDLDEEALEIARRSLQLRWLDHARAAVALSALPDLRATLRHGDALLDSSPWPAPDARCTILLGNPPWVGGEHLSPSLRARLPEFEMGRRGQPDLFKLFYERSFRDLLADGGTHAFVIPDALLARAEHADLRAFIARHGTLVRLAHLGKVFEHPSGARAVGVSAAAILVEKRAPRPDDACRIDRWCGDHAEPAGTIALTEIVDPSGASWCIAAPPGWFGPAGLRRRLEATRTTLGDLLRPGPEGITRGEELGKSRLDEKLRARGRTKTSAIYAGADVRRFHAAAPARRLPLAALRKNLDYYRGPKLLFVKTGAGPVVARVDDDLPALQSVYVLHLRDGLDLDGAAAVIAGALSCAYAFYRWTSGKRLQPQLTIDDVRALPFPPLDEDLPALLARLGDRVRSLRALLDDQPAAARAERALDDAVAAAFGLTLDEWMPLLAGALDNLPRSQRPRWWPP